MDTEEDPNREIEHDNRRQSKRQSPEIEPTHIWISVERGVKGRVIDESKGGLGVHIEDKTDAEMFTVGFHVRVEHLGKRRTANVAYLDTKVADGFRLGLEWLD